MGLFNEFIPDKSVRMIAVEAGGSGKQIGQHARRIGPAEAKDGVFQGYKSKFLQTASGNIAHTHSIAAGLDYPGIGPELAELANENRVEFSSVTDTQVLEAYHVLAKTEGVLPALESAHAVAYVLQNAKSFDPNSVVVIGVSGSGDKDMFTVARMQDDKQFKDFLTEEASRYA